MEYRIMPMHVWCDMYPAGVSFNYFYAQKLFLSNTCRFYHLWCHVKLPWSSHPACTTTKDNFEESVKDGTKCAQSVTVLANSLPFGLMISKTVKLMHKHLFPLTLQLFSTTSFTQIHTRWFKYDRDWFVCKQAALRSSCATLREWSHNLHPPSCSG